MGKAIMSDGVVLLANHFNDPNPGCLIDDFDIPRHVECIYCNEPYKDIICYEDIRNYDQNEWIFVGLGNNGELSVSAHAGTYEPNYLEAYRKINYCPMCGRKLNEDESEGKKEC